MLATPSSDPLDGAVVAHILPFTGIGGNEHGTLRVMKAVRPFGVKCIAFSLNRAPEVHAFFSDAGFTVVEWPEPEPSLLRGLGIFWKESRSLAAEFTRLGVSLVHCSDFKAAFHVSLAGRIAGIPVLCHIRNRYSDLAFRDKVFLLPVSMFAFVSQDTWNRFAFKVSKARGTVLYDGLEPPDDAVIASAFECGQSVKDEFGFPATCRLVGMVARVAPQKDFPTLIRAALIVVKSFPDARFIIIGDNSVTDVARNHFPEIWQLVLDAGLENHFVFTGYRSDTFRLLNGLDVSVLSTHHEGLPLVLIEAMAYEKPIVATSVDGVPELITDGVNGLLYRHQDSDELAEKLLSILTDAQLASTLAREARRTVLTRFTQQNFIESVCSLYRKILR